MIRQEQLDETLVRTYSDRGVYIFGGEPEGNYDEAIDPIGVIREYIETDIPIESVEIEDSDALHILLGREIDDTEISGEVP